MKSWVKSIPIKQSIWSEALKRTWSKRVELMELLNHPVITKQIFQNHSQPHKHIRKYQYQFIQLLITHIPKVSSS